MRALFSFPPSSAAPQSSTQIWSLEAVKGKPERHPVRDVSEAPARFLKSEAWEHFVARWEKSTTNRQQTVNKHSLCCVHDAPAVKRTWRVFVGRSACTKCQLLTKQEHFRCLLIMCAVPSNATDKSTGFIIMSHRKVCDPYEVFFSSKKLNKKEMKAAQRAINGCN